MDTKKLRETLDIFKRLTDEDRHELNIIYDLMRDGQFMESRRRLGILLGHEYNLK